MSAIQIISKTDVSTKNSFSLNEIGFELTHYHSLLIEKLQIVSEGAVYLFVQEGTVTINDDNCIFKIGRGYYLAKKTPIELELGENTYLFIVKSKSHVFPLNNIGGPIEQTGRLNYIDGCSDTLLLPPSRLGEPCLNFLHFPSHTIQTLHNHPSFRYGIIIRGKGVCKSNDGTSSLNTGDIFYIPAWSDHKFDTSESSMDIIAFHPDSDWGPTDNIHPMINRTWVNGKKI